MKKKNDVVRERVDAVDETILLALKEGAQSHKNLRVLSGINYNTFRQRLEKLVRYNYIARSGYGKYALTEKGKRFVEELTLPMATDLKDPKLKKLIDMLPTELHRAFLRLLLSGIIAKCHLADAYDDIYPAFILGGETKGFKTALAKVICRLLGLKPEENIYPLFSAIAGEYGVRRFRMKGNDHYSIAASPLFKQPFICLDEFDKVTDRDTKRNVLFLLDGRRKFGAEGETVENRVCTMVTLNTKIGKEDIKRFGIPDPYIRRSIVADTEHVRMELRDVDLVAKKIFEMKDFPRINLDKLRIACTELPDDVFNCLRDLLMNCTNEEFQGLVDTMPLVILTLGRSVLLDGDVREAMFQTLWDRLICLESLGGTVAGWREKVGKEWARYKQEEQPEMAKQLEEVAQREKEQKSALEERKGEIQRRKADQIGAKYELVYQRQLLVKDIKDYIPRFQYNHPELAKTLAALWREVNTKAVTEEALNTYRLTFRNILNQKVLPTLEEEKRRQDTEARKRKQLSEINSIVEKVNALNKRYQGFSITNTEIENWLAELQGHRRKVEAGQDLTMADYLLHSLTIPWGMQRLEATLVGIKQKKEEEAKSAKENERQAAIRKKEQEQIERKRKMDKVRELQACLKPINRYLGRKELKEGEDPVLTLQQLQIVQPVEGVRFLKVSDKPVKGCWVRDRWSGKLKYSPPVHDFIDYGATIQRWSNEVTKGKLYKWFREVQSWTSWVAVWPLLQAKRTQYLRQIELLTGSNNVEKR